MKNTAIFFAVIFTIISCKPEITSSNKIPAEPKLLFSSGFEGDVYLGPFPERGGDFQPILGKDTETGYSWPIDILGATESALHPIPDRNNNNPNALVNEIQTVIGHTGDSTKALYNYEAYYENVGVTQCPYEILNIKEGAKDLYIRYWIKLDSASLTQPDMWRTFFEWKSQGYAIRNGFRLISFIYTDSDGIPYWHFQGDKFPRKRIWEIDNKTVPVPMNEWFLTEFYWHWSEGEDGRALWRVNGQVIGDHYGPSTRRSKPIDFIMITQIYGNANPKYQWIDDIEIWDGIPEKYK